MKKEYKNYLVATDLDGTLLNSSKKVDIKTLEYLRKLIKKGLNFTFATSRPYQAAKRFSDLLELKIPAIVSSGSMIYDFKNQEIVYSDRLNKDILNIIRQEYDFDRVFIHTDKGIAMRKDNPRYAQFTKENKYFKPIFSNECNFESLIFSQITVLPHDINDFIYKYKEALKAYDVNLFEGGNGAVCIVNKGISKANGVLRLAEELKIAKDKIIVFGDNLNDLEMLEAFDNSYAMGNSDIEIKKIAKFITTTNDDNGVSKGLKSFFNK